MDTRFSDPKAEHLWTHACIGLAFVSDDGRWLRANNYLCSLLGYSESELLHRTFQEVTHPDDIEADEEMVRWVLEGRIPFYTMTKRYLTKDSRVVWIRLHVSRVQGENDDESGMFLSQITPTDKGADAPNPATPPATVDDVARFLRAHWPKMLWVGGVLAAAVTKLLRVW